MCAYVQSYTCVDGQMDASQAIAVRLQGKEWSDRRSGSWTRTKEPREKNDGDQCAVFKKKWKERRTYIGP